MAWVLWWNRGSVEFEEACTYLILVSCGFTAGLLSSSLKAVFPQPSSALSGLKQQESGTAVKVGTIMADGSSLRCRGAMKAF